MLRLLLNFGGPARRRRRWCWRANPVSFRFSSGCLPWRVLEREVPLCAFTLEETAEYVAHRLRAAGAERSIIEPDAIPALHDLSRGVPRQINRLCDLALLIGFAEERQTLGAEQFEAVCRELVAVEPE